MGAMMPRFRRYQVDGLTRLQLEQLLSLLRLRNAWRIAELSAADRAQARQIASNVASSRRSFEHRSAK
jgi:hypothetical protein